MALAETRVQPVGHTIKNRQEKSYNLLNKHQVTACQHSDQSNPVERSCNDDFGRFSTKTLTRRPVLRCRIRQISMAFGLQSWTLPLYWYPLSIKMTFGFTWRRRSSIAWAESTMVITPRPMVGYLGSHVSCERCEQCTYAGRRELNNDRFRSIRSNV